jgi:hypothetical protein
MESRKSNFIISASYHHSNGSRSILLCSATKQNQRVSSCIQDLKPKASLTGPSCVSSPWQITSTSLIVISNFYPLSTHRSRLHLPSLASVSVCPPAKPCSWSLRHINEASLFVLWILPYTPCCCPSTLPYDAGCWMLDVGCRMMRKPCGVDDITAHPRNSEYRRASRWRKANQSILLSVSLLRLPAWAAVTGP